MLYASLGTLEPPMLGKDASFEEKFDMIAGHDRDMAVSRAAFLLGLAAPALLCRHAHCYTVPRF